MMKWRKSPEALVNAFQSALPEDARVERRKMFGYPCAFVNGNMFTGLHQENLIVRLAEGDRQKLVSEKGAEIFAPFPGRLMKEYVSLPPAIIDSAKELKGWLRRSLEHAATLPPKGAKRAAPRAAKKPAAAKAGTARKRATSSPAKKKSSASRARSAR
ncbi:TfoX/Sxy family protein [Hyalangium sp.]|uniref:TfoX/Sxy family protein n=1 Tax=Hyalangium sp. TaxID=2028555 RepID=UPI002D2D0AA7|nr:TfoX/Sxy family protein [Hyalangium sp.]HYI00340.1 TfoX/Sxy family protein [Hyalangium sp.]